MKLYWRRMEIATVSYRFQVKLRLLLVLTRLITMILLPILWASWHKSDRSVFIPNDLRLYWRPKNSVWERAASQSTRGLIDDFPWSSSALRECTLVGCCERFICEHEDNLVSMFSRSWAAFVFMRTFILDTFISMIKRIEWSLLRLNGICLITE